MKLTHVKIHKFKSIETEQSFVVEDDITVLVGMNEAGKTSVLEAIAKVNYFTADKAFEFNTTHDYPRKEKKQLDKSGTFPPAVSLTFSLDQALLDRIASDIGTGLFTSQTLVYTKNYDNAGTFELQNIDAS